VSLDPAPPAERGIDFLKPLESPKIASLDPWKWTVRRIYDPRRWNVDTGTRGMASWVVFAPIVDTPAWAVPLKRRIEFATFTGAIGWAHLAAIRCPAVHPDGHFCRMHDDIDGHPHGQHHAIGRDWPVAGADVDRWVLRDGQPARKTLWLRQMQDRMSALQLDTPSPRSKTPGAC
jgi:hypothetical protein